MCVECFEVFDKISHLRQHISRDHKLECKLCGVVFTTKSNLSTHLKTVHKTPDYLSQDDSSSVTNIVTEYMSSRASSVPNSVVGSDFMINSDNAADVDIDDNTILGSDNDSESEENEMTLSECDLVQDISQSNNHSPTIETKSLVETLSRSYPNSGISCDVDTNIPSNKKKNITDGSLLTNENPEIRLDEKVDYLDILSPPLTPVSSFICDACGRNFTRKSSLRFHRKRTHRIVDISEYKCTFNGCGSTFKHRHNIIKHIESKHEGIKQYTCQICAAEFYYKQAFQRHIKSVHDKSPSTTKRTAWNKLTLSERISGYVKDDRVRHYVENQRKRALGSLGS